MSHLLAKPLFFNRRIVFYLVILLFLQCIIAYSALLVFDSLPSSLTDVPEDHVVFRESQRGTVNLIRMRINENKNRPLQEVVDELQPYFSYPIEILPINTVLPHSVFQELKNLGFAYDSDKEVVYIDLNDGNLLQLGPIIMGDILQSNIMSLTVFIIIWALFSAIIFFILIYFAFSAVWKDLVNIRQTAEQLGQGNLKARTKNVKGWLFKPLANVLNNMGTHIEHLVSTNQTISHAMAHELRTPLARMRFALGMLEESNDKQEKLLLQKGMSDDINELETLISASLNYFKMQQNSIDLNLTQISLKQWGEKVCQSLELFKPKGFKLVCNSEDVLAIIDTSLAETIVKNLLLNAFKYATHKALLNIKKQKNGVVIEIDDDGPGIPFEAREKIFMPFARLDTSRTLSTGGYGLGLAYVKLMAEFHDGNAFVVTSPLGGARFVVSLKSNYP